MSAVEATLVRKIGGPLTKRISLDPAGHIVSDGSPCFMITGKAKRWLLHGVGDVAEQLADFGSADALLLGALRPDLPQRVEITTQRRMNGAGRPDLICRTLDYIGFNGEPALALLDYDTKGMPAGVAARIAAAGGFWEALVVVVPELATVARVVRASTSAGLYRSDTGERLPGSSGQHVYLIVKHGADIERFLKALHQRCWLAGFGWLMLGAAGQLLERSIVDRTVGSPERLVFEGPPQLVAPLAQDAEVRRPVVVEGEAVDSQRVCPSLSPIEETQLRELLARETLQVRPEAERVRAAYVREQAKRLTDVDKVRIIERRCCGVLLPDGLLEFDDPKIGVVTVAAVMADPGKFVDETLADPIEGVGYGRNKAKVLPCAGGVLIHSFAHGLNRVFRLQHDRRSIDAAILAAKPEDVPEVLARYAAAADINSAEIDILVGIATRQAKAAGIGRRAIKAILKAAQEKAAEEQEAEARLRRTARSTEIQQGGVSLEDFHAYMPQHNYIYMPTREPWPAASVDARIPPIPIGEDTVPAHQWLDENRPVEQMTWAPGEPVLIEGRLISEGGWIERKGVKCLNLYRPPTIEPGDPGQAEKWLGHVRLVYPENWQHIVGWFAHRVQHPEQKINHALVFGGLQGIGKDTIVEPVKRAVGPWNFQEASPKQITGRFNGLLKSVILRISEARDLGDVDRFKFYDHMKAYTAAPPDCLRVDEKNLREHAILNCCGVLITSNYKTDGIYLPADDRRHYVTWSNLTKEDFKQEYWDDLWQWYDAGGDRNVAAYLRGFDLSAFNAKAPPPKTEAFWEIAAANRVREDDEMADALDCLERPDCVTIDMIAKKAEYNFSDWLRDRKNSRRIPHRLDQCGYVRVRNPNADDGQWVIYKRRCSIYAKTSLSIEARYRAVQKWLKEMGMADAGRTTTGIDEEPF